MPPVPKSIKLSAPGGVAIQWSDGHASIYESATLRKKCPCAQCRDNPPQVDSEDNPFRVIGREPIRVQSAEAVGRYAIQFFWNDGHSSGIYTYEYLREICRCQECSALSGQGRE
jgi:DUF971 family protein